MMIAWDLDAVRTERKAGAGRVALRMKMQGGWDRRVRRKGRFVLEAGGGVGVSNRSLLLRWGILCSSCRAGLWLRFGQLVIR